MSEWCQPVPSEIAQQHWLIKSQDQFLAMDLLFHKNLLSAKLQNILCANIILCFKETRKIKLHFHCECNTKTDTTSSTAVMGSQDILQCIANDWNTSKLNIHDPIGPCVEKVKHDSLKIRNKNIQFQNTCSHESIIEFQT